MTNDEVKGKIAEIVKPVLKRERISCNEDKACERCWFPCAVERLSRDVADALIESGIGDVKAAEHRAEVGERALKNCSKRLSVFTKSFGDGATEEEVYNKMIKIAEKELSEENEK